MLAILRQPFPPFVPSLRALRVCAAAAFSVLFILFVLKPFGMDNYEVLERLQVASLYALNTFIVASISACVVPLLAPKLFQEDGWTVGKEILFFLVVVTVIAAGNFLLDHWIGGANLALPDFLQTLGVTYSVAFVPVSISVLVKQHYLNKKYKSASQELNTQLRQLSQAGSVSVQTSGETAATGSIAVLVLTGDNQEEKLELPGSAFISMTAANNYVKVYYRSQDLLQNKILRTTLKSMEIQTSQYPELIRCHRSYLVNLSKVTAVTGNAQGYKLHIAGMDEPIPVGRNYNVVIKEKLAHL